MKPFETAVVSEPIWKVARDEADCWDLPRGLVIAILFCFATRLTTGKTFEELFPPKTLESDYEI